MGKEFEKDELLTKLAKTAGKQKTPTLSEDLLYSATRVTEKFGLRKWHTPKLIVNLAGGAAVLSGIFMLSLNNVPNSSIQPLIDPNAKVDTRIASGSNLLAMGDKTFTEEELINPLPVSLAAWGERAVGNYVSNNPENYKDEIWSGATSPTWIFVVADGVYFPNDASSEIKTLLGSFSWDQVSQQLSADSNQHGIKLLIQDESGTLFPLVIRENPESNLYLQARDILLSQTFSLVPTN